MWKEVERRRGDGVSVDGPLLIVGLHPVPPDRVGEESSLGKKDGCISLLLRLRRLVGALTLAAVQEIPGSVKEVPDAD